MITAGAITVFDVSVPELKTFRDQFDLLYLGDPDDGDNRLDLERGHRQL